MTLLRKFLFIGILFTKFCFASDIDYPLDLSACPRPLTEQADYFLTKTSHIPITGLETRDEAGHMIDYISRRPIADAKFLADSIARLTRPNIKIDEFFLINMNLASMHSQYSYEKIIQVINNLPDRKFQLSSAFIRDVFFVLPQEHADEYFLFLNFLIKMRPFGWAKLDYIFRNKLLDRKPVYFASIAPKYRAHYEKIYKRRYKRMLQCYGTGYLERHSTRIPGHRP